MSGVSSTGGGVIVCTNNALLLAMEKSNWTHAAEVFEKDQGVGYLSYSAVARSGLWAALAARPSWEKTEAAALSALGERSAPGGKPTYATQMMALEALWTTIGEPNEQAQRAAEALLSIWKNSYQDAKLAIRCLYDRSVATGDGRFTTLIEAPLSADQRSDAVQELAAHVAIGDDWLKRVVHEGDGRLLKVLRDEVAGSSWREAALTAMLLSEVDLGKFYAPLTKEERSKLFEGATDAESLHPMVHGGSFSTKLRARCLAALESHVAKEVERVARLVIEINGMLQQGDHKTAVDRLNKLDHSARGLWFQLANVLDLAFVVLGALEKDREASERFFTQAEIAWTDVEVRPPALPQRSLLSDVPDALRPDVRATVLALRSLEGALVTLSDNKRSTDLQMAVNALSSIEASMKGGARATLLRLRPRLNSGVKRALDMLGAASAGSQAEPLALAIRETDLGAHWGERLYRLGTNTMLELFWSELRDGPHGELVWTAMTFSLEQLGEALVRLSAEQQQGLSFDLALRGLPRDHLERAVEAWNKKTKPEQSALLSALDAADWKRAAELARRVRKNEPFAQLTVRSCAVMMLAIRGLGGSHWNDDVPPLQSEHIGELVARSPTGALSFCIAQGLHRVWVAMQLVKRAPKVEETPAGLAELNDHLLFAHDAAWDYLRWFLGVLASQHTRDVEALLGWVDTNSARSAGARAWRNKLQDGGADWWRRIARLGGRGMIDLFFEQVKAAELRDSEELSIAALTTLNGLNKSDIGAALTKLTATQRLRLRNVFDSDSARSRLPEWIVWLDSVIDAVHEDAERGQTDKRSAVIRGLLREARWDDAVGVLMTLSKAQLEHISLLSGEPDRRDPEWSTLRLILIVAVVRRIGQGDRSLRGWGAEAHAWVSARVTERWIGFPMIYYLRLMNEWCVAAGALVGANRAMSPDTATFVLHWLLVRALPGAIPVSVVEAPGLLDDALTRGFVYLTSKQTSTDVERALSRLREGRAAITHGFDPGERARLIRQLVWRDYVAALELLARLRLHPDDSPWDEADPALMKSLDIHPDRYGVLRVIWRGHPNYMENVVWPEARLIAVAANNKTDYTHLLAPMVQTLSALDGASLESVFFMLPADVIRALEERARLTQPEWHERTKSLWGHKPQSELGESLSGLIDTQVTLSVSQTAFVMEIKLDSPGLFGGKGRGGKGSWFTLAPLKVEVVPEIELGAGGGDLRSSKINDEGVRELTRELKLAGVELWGCIPTSFQLEIMSSKEKFSIALVGQAGIVTLPLIGKHELGVKAGPKIELDWPSAARPIDLSVQPIGIEVKRTLNVAEVTSRLPFDLQLAQGYSGKLHVTISSAIQLNLKALVGEAAKRTLGRAFLPLAAGVITYEIAEWVREVLARGENLELLRQMMRGWANLAEDCAVVGLRRALTGKTIDPPSLGEGSERVPRYQPEGLTDGPESSWLVLVTLPVYLAVAPSNDGKAFLIWLNEAKRIQRHFLTEGEGLGSAVLKAMAEEMSFESRVRARRRVVPLILDAPVSVTPDEGLTPMAAGAQLSSALQLVKPADLERWGRDGLAKPTRAALGRAIDKRLRSDLAYSALGPLWHNAIGVSPTELRQPPNMPLLIDQLWRLLVQTPTPIALEVPAHRRPPAAGRE